MAKDKHYSMYEIFGVARDVPRNYVVRDQVDTALVDALTQNKHIVIHGSSKQGKTSLRKNTLLTTDYIYVTCSNKWTLVDLHNAILKAAGFKVEGATSRTASGALKVNATLEANARALLFGGKASASAETDAELAKLLTDCLVVWGVTGRVVPGESGIAVAADGVICTVSRVPTEQRPARWLLQTEARAAAG